MGSDAIQVAQKPDTQLKHHLVPHVVLIAIPAPGHAIPFVAFAKLLAGKGIKVTFLSSGIVPDKLQHELEVESDQQELDITYRSVVDEPIPEPEHLTKLEPWLQKFSREEMVALAVDIIKSLPSPPCCIITDFLISWGGEVAKKLELPRHYLITMSAASLSFMFSVPLFQNQGLLPIEISSDATDLVVPGVGTIPPGDVWEYFKISPFQNDGMIELLRIVREAAETSMYLINTYEELEQPTFKALRAEALFSGKAANVLAIGPLVPTFAVKGEIDTLDEAIDVEKKSKKLSCNIEQWLDAQPLNSVLYIAYGSIFSPSAEQIKELAYGLEASEQRFLWVLRLPDTPQIMVSKQTSQAAITTLLPQGFEERTRGRGLVISSWAPQLKILTHRAVGLFMSHCGWNSILEAIAASIPIMACPCFVDQRMNARFIVESAKCGMMVTNGEGVYQKQHIEKSIRVMLQGEEGSQVRRNMKNLNRLLRKALLSSTGSSRTNLQHYVDKICALGTQCNQVAS